MNDMLPQVDVSLRRKQAETMLALSRIHQRLLGVIRTTLERHGVSDLTPARANALLVLFQARQPLHASQLAAQLAVSEVTVSRLVKRLVDDGWVERSPDPSDRRAMLLGTTARAKTLFPQLVDVTNSVMDALFAGLDDAELEELVQWMGRIQHNLSDPPL